MKKIKYFKLASTVLLAVLILSGCKQELSSTLYVGDLVDTVSSDKAMTTSAEIKMEMTSSDSCNKNKDRFTRIISPFFVNLEKIQCIDEGSNAYYYAVFELPMIKVLKNGEISDKYEGGASVQLSTNDFGDIFIYLKMNLDLLSVLDKDLRNEFLGINGIDPNDMKVKISINNDIRDVYVLHVEGSFLDGVAINPRFSKKVDLKRRSESTIELSNVSVFALTGRGNETFAYVGAITPKTTESKN